MNLFNRVKRKLLSSSARAIVTVVVTCLSFCAVAQDAALKARITTRMDPRRITVGDHARLFLEVPAAPAGYTLHWAQIPDSFNSLEVVERGKIDTLKQGAQILYKQRVVLTGFDSGVFTVPAFAFIYSPAEGDHTISVYSDSFQVLVQTVAVDTTKAFKPIKGLMAVKSSWLDYLWLIIGALVFVALGIFVAWYFIKNKKAAVPKPTGPVETLQERTLRLLGELDARQLWQKKQVKEYYIVLTDIIRTYIEQRFHTPAMELTTDELLYKVQYHRELQPYHSILATILSTADLAKFAKAEPLPQEHMDAMDKAKEFVASSKPAEAVPPTETPNA
ncbi:MAG: hypothetical protein V4649_10685 [Bacteroidota bacterium]